MAIEDAIKLLNQIGMEYLGCNSSKRVAKKYKIAKCPKCDHHLKVPYSITWKRLARVWCEICRDETGFVKDTTIFSTTSEYKCKCNSCKGKILS